MGTSSAFEVGSAAIKNMADKSIPMPEAIEMGIKEVGASTPVELKELLSKASELEQKINTNLPKIEKTVIQEVSQVTNQTTNNIKVEQSIEKQSTEINNVSDLSKQEKKSTQLTQPIRAQKKIANLDCNIIGKPEELRLSEIELEQLEKYHPFNEKRAQHMFRVSGGHFEIDNPQNRDLIAITIKSKNYLGPDIHGNQWFAEIQKDGSQLWAGTRNGKICYGGMNKIPLKYNSVTGLCNLNNT